MSERISETDLIIPALYLMLNSPNGISTSELIIKLREQLSPTGEDLMILEGRNDDKFSQKVRNLRSHQTFERYGYAKYEENLYFITNKGKELLETKKDDLNYLIFNNFKENDKKKCFVNLAKNENFSFISEDMTFIEGEYTEKTAKRRKRSINLMKLAREYFKKQYKKLSCRICTFDFENKYGKIGKDFIELHHIKPICFYDDKGEEKQFQDAIKNLIPVCPNCHRMLHKDISIKDLQDLLNEDRKSK